MKSNNWLACVSGSVFVVLSAMSAAQAQTATVTKVKFTTPAGDAVAGKFFDRLTSKADPLNPNKLIIGLNQGINAATLTSNTFTASTQAFYRTAAMDTIYFQVQALPGYYLSRVTYSQRGTCSTARTGLASAGANWVVDGVPREIGLFGARRCEASLSTTSHALSGTVDLTDKHRSAAAVSITSSLFVFATPQVGSASISLTGADVLVVACNIAQNECPCVGAETTRCRPRQ
jgi:hypothetical protein